MSEAQPAIFTTLGIFLASQEISARALETLEEPNPQLLAEETLCMVSVASARAVQAVAPERGDLHQSFLVTPFLYRDYLVGTQMLEREDASHSAEGALVGDRLERKIAFYTSHFPASTLPIGSLLENVMLMWMGRISPPGMPTGPGERLQNSGAMQKLQAHIRVLASYMRHGKN